MYQNIFFDNITKKIHLWDDTSGYRVIQYKKYAYVKDSYGQSVYLYGDKVKKIFRWDDDQRGLFESDVNAEIRTLVDTYTDSDEPSTGHKRLYFDIEVEVTDGFPSVEKAENKITSIAFYDALMDEYYCYVLDEKNRVKDSKVDNETIVSFDSEYDLLNKFFIKYMEIQPTILSGWNIENFDIPYLYNRACVVVGQDVANALSPIKIVRWSNFKKSFRIAGVSSLDYLHLYKTFTFSQRSSYRLDDIANYELGEKKISYDGTLNDLYENEIDKFIEYNLQDVKLISKLDKKLDHIDIARGICHMGHCPYEDVFMSSRYLEGAILVYLKKLGIVAPNKNIGNRKLLGNDDKFAGAFVQEPQKGKHNWVYDLDITSMYPSTIRSLNISPETKIGKITGWDSKEFIKKTQKTYTITNNGKELGRFTETELADFLNNTNCSVADNGVMYRTDKKGLIPSLLTKWFDERVEYRKLAKKFAEDGNDEKYGYFNRRQHLQKILLNSMYGVLGLPVFRFYDVDNAEATTLTGQSLIKFTKTIANNFYNKELSDNKDYCIYIDTDSVFYSAIPLVKKRFPNSDLSDVMMTQRILEIASEVQTYLNKSYNYFAKKFCNIDEHFFEIKQEVIAKSGLFITKKRYGMKIINDNGVKVNKMLVKGIDTVRSNFPAAMRKFLEIMLDDILMDVPKDKIDDKVVAFKSRMKKANYDSISMPTGVKNIKKFINNDESSSILTSYHKGTPVHVKSALFYNDLMKYFKQQKKYQFISAGDKIKWVYLKQNPIGIDVVAYKGHEDPPQILGFIQKYIDYDKIFNTALKKKLDMFYEALGWGEVVDKQNSMERFF